MVDDLCYCCGRALNDITRVVCDACGEHICRACGMTQIGDERICDKCKEDFESEE